MGDLLKKQGAKFEYGTARLEDRAGVLADIERVGAGGGAASVQGHWVLAAGGSRDPWLPSGAAA